MLNKYNANTRKLNRIIPKINVNHLNDSLYLTGSLENIEIPSAKKFQSQIRKNPNPIKLVNNKTKINDFRIEILQNSGMYISREIDEFDNIANTLTIRNVKLDYGTEGASAENFEVLINGLHLPGNYTITEVGMDVVIKFFDDLIDYDSLTKYDIHVIGKLLEIPIATEDNFIITTEDGLDIII